ncbi:MAG: tRNA lysidine(34) synthetase TilS, partial [Gammaproteobacteria bacterium]|nr:tRNA lysidine(34) synthetase TilS [Gammaproteobacteria bacterium]
MPFDPDDLVAVLAHHAPAARYWVAYSGGLDSLVLLHALAARRDRLGAPLAAVHVDHGLHPDSGRWAAHCARTCAALGVPYECRVVEATAASGESPEAAARRARYEALAGLLEPGACLLTAHQRDDQAETLLLQLLRGAGPDGLAGMPMCRPLGAGWHLRPLLDWERADLHAYARAQGLEWVEDASNRDTGIDRNYLRHIVLPALRERWPGAPATLARAARHQAEAAELLVALGRADARAAADAAPGTLRASALRDLPAPRQRNLLRAWIARAGLPAPSAAQLERVRLDVCASR